MRYRLQRHDGTDCSATMVPITVLRLVPIQRYRQGAAKASIITSSEITPDSEMATVICQIKNAFIINPINGKAERFSSLQDTLQLIKEGNKWLVRKDIPLQNGKQNHD